MQLPFPVEYLPTLNAGLNALATLLLVIGYLLIKRHRVVAHRRTMYAAFGVSVLFLASYLVYHYHAGSVRFVGPPSVRAAYLVVLVSHIVLAAAVPPLALLTIYYGVRDLRWRHRRLARWTFPIWLYVSITGVVIYAMLYHLYPASSAPASGTESGTAPGPAPLRSVDFSPRQFAAVSGEW